MIYFCLASEISIQRTSTFSRGQRYIIHRCIVYAFLCKQLPSRIDQNFPRFWHKLFHTAQILYRWAKITLLYFPTNSPDRIFFILFLILRSSTDGANRQSTSEPSRSTYLAEEATPTSNAFDNANNYADRTVHWYARQTDRELEHRGLPTTNPAKAI